MDKLSVHGQWTPYHYQLIPFILISRVEDTSDNPIGWLLSIGWLGLEINFIKED